MPRDRPGPDDPREWIRRARSNLNRAHTGSEVEGVYESAAATAAAVLEWAETEIEGGDDPPS